MNATDSGTAREFTDADRAKVEAVFRAALDELSDSYTSASMYEPFAALVLAALDVPAEMIGG